MKKLEENDSSNKAKIKQLEDIIQKKDIERNNIIEKLNLQDEIIKDYEKRIKEQNNNEKKEQI